VLISLIWEIEIQGIGGCDVGEGTLTTHLVFVCGIVPLRTRFRLRLWYGLLSGSMPKDCVELLWCSCRCCH
jgi:hypothetical protein